MKRILVPSGDQFGLTTRENLPKAIAMVLEANRELFEDAAQGGEVIRQPIKVGA